MAISLCLSWRTAVSGRLISIALRRVIRLVVSSEGPKSVQANAMHVLDLVIPSSPGGSQQLTSSLSFFSLLLLLLQLLQPSHRKNHTRRTSDRFNSQQYETWGVVCCSRAAAAAAARRRSSRWATGSDPLSHPAEALAHLAHWLPKSHGPRPLPTSRVNNYHLNQA